MRDQSAKKIALGGMLAALALVIMCLGGMIPVATYVCPMLCMLVLSVVLKLCGSRIAWAWYGAVALLGLLLGPDKEAAAVFLFLGYYPILKPRLDKLRLKWLWKLLLFNTAVLALYSLLIYLMGLGEIMADFRELGVIGVAITLLLGNVTFFMVDLILSRGLGRKRH